MYQPVTSVPALFVNFCLTKQGKKEQAHIYQRVIAPHAVNAQINSNQNFFQLQITTVMCVAAEI